MISSLIVINKNNKKLNTGYKNKKIKKVENKSFLKNFFQAKNAQELPENLLLVNLITKYIFMFTNLNRYYLRKNLT